MPSALHSYLKEKAALTGEQMELLSAYITEKSFLKGSRLLRQGNVCSEMFFVEEGLLRSFTIDDGGKEHIIQFAPENWWIGDRDSFYFERPSLFFIDAIEDTTVAVLQKEFFTKAAAMSSSFNQFNTMALHNSIRYMQCRINALLSHTAEQRYLDFVELYPSLLLRVPQWMIAAYLGITPESLSRVRKELARKNFRS